MRRLENKNMQMCFSLLREFIDEAQTSNNKKGTAIMALEQLQKVTGGKDVTPYSSCILRPLVE